MFNGGKIVFVRGGEEVNRPEQEGFFRDQRKSREAFDEMEKPLFQSGPDRSIIGEKAVGG